jgi:hypothetical protein
VSINSPDWKKKKIRLTIYNKILINATNLQRIRENATVLGLKKEKYDDNSGSIIFTYGNHS